MKIGTKSQFPVLFILFSFVSLCCCEEYTFENSTIGLPNKNVRNVSLSITRADDYVEDASANGTKIHMFIRKNKLDDIKEFYYRGLKEWENERGYLIDTCLSAQDKFKTYMDYFGLKY